MKFRKVLCALILALFGLQTLQFTARADEGMWPFNNIPRAEIKRKYGFEVTDAWLRKVQLASVRFNNGGSGSFVSPNGLVLTNYHIVEDIVNEVSTPEKDLAKEGFVARSRSEEIKAPSLELNVLMSIEDVTKRVNDAVNRSGFVLMSSTRLRGVLSLRLCIPGYRTSEEDVRAVLDLVRREAGRAIDAR